MNKLILVNESNTSLQWLYVNGVLEKEGDEQISTEQWMSVIRKFKSFDELSEYDLTKSYCDKIECDFNSIPYHFKDFEAEDLE